MEEINQNPQIPQPSSPSAPIMSSFPSSKSRLWLKIGLILAVIIIFIASVSGAYWLGMKQVKLPWQSESKQPKNEQVEQAKAAYEVGQTVRGGKLYLTINKAEKAEQSFSFVPQGKQAIFLEVTFENKDAVEGKNATDSELRFAMRDFRLTDEEGFVQDPVVPSDVVQGEISSLGIIKFIEPLAAEKLAVGEKYRGYLIYTVPKDKSKFALTYSGIKFLITPTPPQASLSIIPPEMFGPDNIPDNAKRVVELAKADILKQFGTGKESINLMLGTVNNWSDNSLGCSGLSSSPATQAGSNSRCLGESDTRCGIPLSQEKMIPGYVLLFNDQNFKFYTYHTNQDPKNYLVKLCNVSSLPALGGSLSCTKDADCSAGGTCVGRGPTQPSKEVPGVCLPSKASQSTY